MHQKSIDSVHWGDWTRVGGLFWRTPQRCHQQEKWPSCTCPLQPSQLYTGGHEGCCIECRLSQPGIVSKRQKMIFGWSFLKNRTVGRSGLNQDFIFMWITHLLMIYEINHIWTAEIKWKWRNDHRSEHNLCNCIKKPEKKFRTSTGFEPVTSWFTGAMLYQLSYEATDVGSRSIVGSYVPVKEMSVNDIYIFFQASFRNCINCVHYNDHFFIFISFPQFIYDLFHISWKWRNDRCSERNLCNCVKKPEKNSGLQRGLNFHFHFISAVHISRKRNESLWYIK